MTKTTLRTSTVATPVDQSLMIDFHVDVVEADAVESFWFEDEADMIDRVRRKLGVERSEGLAAVIRGFPKAHAQAARSAWSAAARTTCRRCSTSPTARSAIVSVI